MKPEPSLLGFFIILVTSNGFWSADDDDDDADDDGAGDAHRSVLIILLGPLDFKRLNL